MIDKIHDLFRKALRGILVFETKETLKKHDPLVIAVVGDNNPSLVREFIYHAIKPSFETVRRNLERTDSEFSIPLTVFGRLTYPKHSIDWIWIIMKTLLQIIRIKPYRHALVIQVHYIRDDIFHTWINALSPDLIIDTADDITNIQKDNGKDLLTYISKSTGLSYDSLRKGVTNAPAPIPRINIILGKNNSFIVDARHYYFPISTTSICEITDYLPGNKFVISDIQNDKKIFPSNYKVIKPKKEIIPEKNAVYIFRGDKNSFTQVMRNLSANELEV